jgi:hypothetical protein
MDNMIPFFLRCVLRHQGEALPTPGMADYEQQAESSDYDQADVRTSEGSTDIRSQLGMRQFNGPLNKGARDRGGPGVPPPIVSAVVDSLRCITKKSSRNGSESHRFGSS